MDRQSIVIEKQPTQARESCAPQTGGERPHQAALSDGQSFRSAPKLLLIRTDDAIVSPVLAAAREASFETGVCLFAEALALLRSNSYDAAVLDSADTSQILSFLQEARHTPHIPIVALMDAAKLNLAFTAGASFAIPRPVAPDLLKNTLTTMYRMAIGQRRQYARHRVHMPVKLTMDGAKVDAIATDIGCGGIALRAAAPLKAGTQVAARFVLPGSDQEIVTVGDVRWSDGRERVGICFTSVAGDGSSALENWIARCDAGVEGSALPPPPQAPTQSDDSELGQAASAADEGRASQLLLIGLLTAFCVFVIGFWIYVAMSSR